MPICPPPDCGKSSQKTSASSITDCPRAPIQTACSTTRSWELMSSTRSEKISNSERLLLDPLPSPSYYRLRRFHFEKYRAMLILPRINPRFGFEHSQDFPFRLLNTQLHAADAVFFDHRVDALDQRLQARTLHSRHVDRLCILALGIGH